MFGQDIVDALFWTATESKGRKREHLGVIPHFMMAVIYVCILFKQKHFTLTIYYYFAIVNLNFKLNSIAYSFGASSSHDPQRRH